MWSNDIAEVDVGGLFGVHGVGRVTVRTAMGLCCGGVVWWCMCGVVGPFVSSVQITHVHRTLHPPLLSDMQQQQ